jgi:hypothetical protein
VDADGTLISAYSEGCFGYLTLDSLYHHPAGFDTTKIKVVKSTDDGVTWGSPIVAYAHHDSVYQLNEPWLDEPAIAVDANDNMVILCRNPDYGTSQLVSSDAGVTWTFVGVVGQTNCGPGVYSSNPTTDILMVNDSTFMFVVGYRLNHLGSGSGNAGKVGYTHFLTGTWNDIKDNSTFGWSTFISPTYSDYGDCGARRIVLTNDSSIAMVQMQGGSFYRITPAEVAASRAGWILSNGQSSQYRPIQTYTFPDRLILSNTTYSTLNVFNIMSTPEFDSLTTLAVGAIPVISVSAQFDDAGGTDTAWVKLTDVNDITMRSTPDSLMFMYIDALTGIPGVRMGIGEQKWNTWFPTRLLNSAGTVQLGQFEKANARVYLKAKSSNGSILNCVTIHMGYIYK